MSFTADASVFPNNVTQAIFTAALLLDPDPDPESVIGVFRRALRATDPNQCISVVPSEWTPDPEGMEIGSVEPTITRYYWGIQAFVRDGDEDRGLATHATMSMAVRGMLYRDAVLKHNLSQLRVDGADGSVERTQRWGVTRQVFLSNEQPQGTFLYLSTLQFWLETEKI